MTGVFICHVPDTCNTPLSTTHLTLKPAVITVLHVSAGPQHNQENKQTLNLLRPSRAQSAYSEWFSSFTSL